MSDERSPEFQAALATLIAQRDSPKAWDVFRDWALSEGYPRGELMALDTELEAARANKTSSARAENARAAFFTAHRATFLGRDALLGDLQLTWKRGFIAQAVAPNVSVHLDCLRELSTHLSGSVLDALECSPTELRAYLEDGPRAVRALTLRGPIRQPSELFDAGQRRVVDFPPDPFPDFGKRLPALERLTLQSPLELDLTRFASDRLVELVFESNSYGAIDVSGTQSILERCPAIRRFVPHQTAPGSLRVRKERRLKTLELEVFTDETARILNESPLHIGTLDLRARGWPWGSEVVGWLATKPPRVHRVLVPRDAPVRLREAVKRHNEWARTNGSKRK